MSRGRFSNFNKHGNGGWYDYLLLFISLFLFYFLFNLFIVNSREGFNPLNKVINSGNRNLRKMRESFLDSTQENFNRFYRKLGL